MSGKYLRLICLAFFLSFTACQSSSKTVALGEWETYKKEFFEDLWHTFPGMASGLGLSQYGDDFKIPNQAYKQERLDFFNKYKARLEGISKTSLATLDGMDYELIRNFLDSSLWEENTFKSAEWDPSVYNAGNAVAAILENGKMDEKEKLRSLTKRLAQIPEYYAAAYRNLTTPTREHTELAIKQNGGLVSYLEGDVKARFKKSTLPADEKAAGEMAVGLAVKAVNTYIGQLTEMKNKLEKKKAFRSFRIGKVLYAQKFKYDLQSGYTAEEMYLRAVKAKQDLHKEMLARAKELWPKYFPKKAPPANANAMIKKVLNRIADDHIQPKDFVPTVERMLPRLVKFIEEKNLLTLDPSKPLKVRETPEYARGFAGASVDAPGPFDAARETYYNVTPLDGMPPEKQQNYLREYNNYTLQILNIHEALPGHYAQLVYSLKSPSLVKSIFGNNAMIEGWAVYGERMMMEAGYNNEPEMWMMYDKWRLRIVCNTILDYSLHNLNMSKRSALRLLRDEAFQEETQIEEKWNRATYSQVQLASYFTGFTEIYELRDEVKKQMGRTFDLKHFNEKFLSYGSAPVKLIRAEMLRTPVMKAGGDASAAKGSNP